MKKFINWLSNEERAIRRVRNLGLTFAILGVLGFYQSLLLDKEKDLLAIGGSLFILLNGLSIFLSSKIAFKNKTAFTLTLATFLFNYLIVIALIYTSLLTAILSLFIALYLAQPLFYLFSSLKLYKKMNKKGNKLASALFYLGIIIMFIVIYYDTLSTDIIK